MQPVSPAEFDEALPGVFRKVSLLLFLSGYIIILHNSIFLIM